MKKEQLKELELKEGMEFVTQYGQRITINLIDGDDIYFKMYFPRIHKTAFDKMGTRYFKMHLFRAQAELESTNLD